MKHILRFKFIPLILFLLIIAWCNKVQDQFLITFLSLNNSMGHKYYFDPKVHTVTRFLKGLSFHIKNKMPIYNIYTLQHVIYLATQFDLQYQRL